MKKIVVPALTFLGTIAIVIGATGVDLDWKMNPVWLILGILFFMHAHHWEEKH